MSTSPKTGPSTDHVKDEQQDVKMNCWRENENTDLGAGLAVGGATESVDGTAHECPNKESKSAGDEAVNDVVGRIKEVQITDGDDDTENLIKTKLQTISQYMALVENKRNHTVLLKEETITGFLILCLGDNAPEVVERSFDVFQALSKQEENLPVIKNLTYIMDALRCVASNSRVKESVRKNAKSIIADLKSLSKDHAPLSELSDSMKNVLASASSNACTTTTVADSKNVMPKHVDPNATMSTMKRKSKGRETILFLENNVLLQKSERARVTQVLISVPGIVSVTYDVKKSLCIIRGKRNVAPEAFGRAVATLGIANVYLVRKNDNKEEVKILIQATDKENTMLPPYPEEQENEEIDNSAALARTDQLPGDDASFFKSAKNFIKRSFYW